VNQDSTIIQQANANQGKSIDSRNNRLFREFRQRNRRKSERQSHARGKQRISTFPREFILSLRGISILRLSKEPRATLRAVFGRRGLTSRCKLPSSVPGIPPGLCHRRSLVSIAREENCTKIRIKIQTDERISKPTRGARFLRASAMHSSRQIPLFACRHFRSLNRGYRHARVRRSQLLLLTCIQ